MRPAFLLLLGALAVAVAVLYSRASVPRCGKDALAELYAQELSRGWREALTGAFVEIDARRLQSQGYVLNASQRERLTDGYRPLVERFYAKEIWLPGIRDHIDNYLSHDEQCSAFAYYGTTTGRKVLLMQLAPGALEFARQQATNLRREDPQFAVERLEMLGVALPDVDKVLRESGNTP